MYQINKLKEFMNMEFKEKQMENPIKPLESCAHYSNLSESELNTYFRQVTNHEKYQTVNSISEQALFYLNNVRFTSIAVDNSTTYSNHIVYIGLSNGRLLKILIDSINLKSKLLRIFNIFDTKTSIDSLIIKSRKIISISNKEIRSIGLDFDCSLYVSCLECIISFEPNCAWSKSKSKCILNSTNNSDSIE